VSLRKNKLGRPKKISVVPDCPQQPGKLVNWDAEGQKYVWKPEQQKLLEDKAKTENETRAKLAAERLEQLRKKRLKAEIVDAAAQPTAIGDQLLARGLANDTIRAKYERAVKYAAIRSEIEINQKTYTQGLIAQYDTAVINGTKLPRQGLKITEEEYNLNHAANEPFVNYQEALALWELCAFSPRWVHKTFLDWLDYRLKGKDLWFFCETLHGMPLVEGPHRPIVDLFPKLTNVGLPRDCDENDLQEYLIELSEIHKYLLLYPRSFWKSSITVKFLALMQICFPALKSMYVTSTYKLSKKFVKAFKKIWETNESSHSLFQEVYPEFTTKPNQGVAEEWDNPMDTNRLNKEPGVRAMSMEAGGTGSHVQLLILDDAAELENTRTIELRQKLMETRTSFRELADPPWSFEITTGTRWSDGPVCADPYGEIIKQQAALPEEERDVKILVGAAMKVHDDVKFMEDGILKPWAELREKPWLELKEEQVDLLWPGKNSKGSWKILREKMRDNLTSFLRQQMNLSVITEEDGSKSFDEESLDNCLIHPNDASLPSNFDKDVTHWGFSDTIHFTEAIPSVTGDESTAAIVTRYFNRTDGVTYLYLRYLWAGREGPDTTAKEIARLQAEAMNRGLTLQRIFIEKAPSIGQFIERIEHFLRVQGMGKVEIQPMEIIRVKNAKTNRISALALKIKSGQCKIVANGLDWDRFRRQALKFDPKAGAGHGRNDDQIDTLSLALHTLCGGKEEPDVPKKVVNDGQPRDHWGRTREEADAAFRAGEPARNAEAVRAMWGDRARIEAQQSQQAREAKEAAASPQWSKAPGGGYFRNQPPIDASGRRAADGTLISKYGVPLRQK
jgi:hypothetical protein